MSKNSKKKIPGKKAVIIFLTVVFIVAVGYVFWSLWASQNLLIVRYFKTDLDNLDTSVRLAVISDLHDHSFGDNNKNLIEQVAQQSPDLIIMDGDMLNGDSETSQPVIELIQQMTTIAPVYYTIGNHEIMYIENGHGTLTDELTQAGAVVLEKNYVDLTVNGAQIRLGGMYDYAFALDANNTAENAPDEVNFFLQDFQNTDLAKIMLCHRPDSFIFGNAADYWDVDLVISGHVHGGQIVLPFLGGVYGQDQGWFPDYVHGLYTKGNIQLFITSGLGTSGGYIPRWNNRPEIAVLEVY